MNKVLSGKVVCSSGYDDVMKKDIESLVKSLGGQYNNLLTNKVNILILNKIQLSGGVEKKDNKYFVEYKINKGSDSKRLSYTNSDSGLASRV